MSCGWSKIIDRERGIELRNGGECRGVKDYDFLPCGFNELLIPENTERATDGFRNSRDMAGYLFNGMLAAVNDLSPLSAQVK